MTTKTQVYLIADIDNMMRALEIAQPAYTQAYDILRQALGIEADEPKQIWQARPVPKQIGRSK